MELIGWEEKKSGTAEVEQIIGAAYGGFITIAIPSWQWLPWEQYIHTGSEFETVMVKKVVDPPLEEGTKPE